MLKKKIWLHENFLFVQFRSKILMTFQGCNETDNFKKLEFYHTLSLIKNTSFLFKGSFTERFKKIIF